MNIHNGSDDTATKSVVVIKKDIELNEDNI